MKRLGKILGIAFTAVVLTYGMMFAYAASGLAIIHTAFPNADATAEFGLFNAVENHNTILQTNMLSKVVVNNNAANPYQVPNSTAYILFTGTQPSATMTISMPSAANSLDSQEVSIYSQASVASAVTFASSGATVLGAPATLTANAHVKFKYDAATTTWFTIDQ